MSVRLALARQQAARFWSKVDKSGACWLWFGGLDKDGYGKFQLTTYQRPPARTQLHVRAHRLAWELTHGVEMPAEFVTLHSCDTPRCVNPDHISAGTQAANRADCTAKGRTARGARHGSKTKPEAWARGSKHHNATIDESIAATIKARLLTVASQASIARELRVSRSVVQQIASGRTWRHVEPARGAA